MKNDENQDDDLAPLDAESRRLIAQTARDLFVASMAGRANDEALVAKWSIRAACIFEHELDKWWSTLPPVPRPPPTPVPSSGRRDY